MGRHELRVDVSNPGPPDAAPEGRPRGMMANAGAVFASRLVVAVLGWSGSILIIRALSKQEWGQFSFVFGFLSLVAVLSNVVNSRVAIHGLLQDDADSFAGSYIVLRGLFGLLAYCVAIGFVVVAGYPPVVVQATALAGLVIVLATPSIAYDAIFQARMRMDRLAIAAVCGQLAQFALTAVLAILDSSLVVFAIPAVLCEIVIVVFKLHWVRALQRVRYVIDTHRWRTMLREAIPLAIGGGLASAYFSLDSVMLSKMDTFRAVGTYGIAYKFVGVVSFLPLAMNAAVLTLLTRSWPSDVATFRHSLQRAGTTMYLVGLLIVVEFGLFSEETIRLLYGGGYTPAADATRLVMTGACVAFFTTLAVTAYAAMSRNRLYPWAALAGLVFNFGVNLVLIPRYSFDGAAWATLATELIVVTVLWVPFVREHGFGPFTSRVVLKGAAAAATTAGIGWVAAEGLGWIAAGWIMAVAYLGLLHLMRIPDRGGLIELVRNDELPSFTTVNRTG